MSEQTLLEQAAEVRERRAALGRTVQELKQLKGDWTQFELAASDAMRIADDGLRNAWQMLDRLNQFGKAEIGKLAAPNAGIQGRCAALSRSVPWNDWLGSVVDKATQNKCIKLLTIV